MCTAGQSFAMAAIVSRPGFMASSTVAPGPENCTGVRRMPAAAQGSALIERRSGSTGSTGTSGTRMAPVSIDGDCLCARALRIARSVSTAAIDA